ncbi:hypothetical protein FGO68_gene7376 [Halteria grandinella]|uniref:Uncharacterized protein n=1 Tax=Halteria grandinella TaxID=5974 RepID=A0A8J8SWG6_HALGN|nr:hypothetical protein FGO68_gene7376 [Halteria grandinella]
MCFTHKVFIIQVIEKRESLHTIWCYVTSILLILETQLENHTDSCQKSCNIQIQVTEQRIQHNQVRPFKILFINRIQIINLQSIGYNC